MLTESEPIRELLTTARTIAVVGASSKPWRDSNGIMHFLISKNYKVYPVNPNEKEIDGLQCYPDLKSIPEKIDIVDIFRNPEHVMPIIEEAIAVGAHAVWMQLGVINEDARRAAENAGLQVVMDRCILVEHRLLLRG